MRHSVLFLCLIFWGNAAGADLPPVGEQMRVIELQQQADEKGQWLGVTHTLYFNKLVFDQVVDVQHQQALEELVAPYRGHFLKPAQVDHLCEMIKHYIKEEGYSFDGFFCEAKEGILKVDMNL